jgi:uncharacterized protein with GYD domain
MPTYVMLTRVSPEIVGSPQTLEELERRAMDQIGEHCPEVKWRQSFAILGPYDYLDIFEAPDNDSATKVSTLIRAHRSCTFGNLGCDGVAALQGDAARLGARVAWQRNAVNSPKTRASISGAWADFSALVRREIGRRSRV